MNKTAVITGAGTGVGRATAIAMAGEGWRLALIGRTEKTLEETARLTGNKATLALLCISIAANRSSMAKCAGTGRQRKGA